MSSPRFSGKEAEAGGARGVSDRVDSREPGSYDPDEDSAEAVPGAPISRGWWGGRSPVQKPGRRRQVRIWRFRAWSRRRKVVQGFVKATTREQALEALWNRRYTPLVIEEVEYPRDRRPGWLLFGGRRLKRHTLAVFTRQLATMYRSGIPLARGMAILFAQTEDRQFARAIGQVYRDLLRGHSLPTAMRAYPHYFSKDYTAMIEAGHRSGTTGRILERLAATLEQEVRVTNRVKGALTYPVFIFAVATLLNLAIFKWILPNFQGIFDALGVNLPLLTRLVMGAARMTNTGWFWTAVVVAGVGLLWALYEVQEIPWVREAVDRYRLRAPVFGPVIQRLTMVDVFATMRNLAGAGVPMHEALNCVAEVSNNLVFEGAFKRMAFQVREGSSLAEAFDAEADLFPPVVAQMIFLGEETGDVDYSFGLLADYFQQELSFYLDTLTALLEPVMIAMMGVFTCIVVLAVFLPIYRMISTMILL